MPTPPNRPSGPPGNGGSSRTVGYLAGFVVCVAIGATLGWNLTDTTPSPAAAVAPTGLASASASSSSAPAHEPSTRPAKSPTNSAVFTIPDYAARGWTFQRARDDLRSHGVQGDPVFAGSGTSQQVDHTNPGAGKPAPPGTTVKIFVDGVAPYLAVPPVPADTRCSVWGRHLASIGFRVGGYKGDKSQPVTAESPDENDPNTVWGDRITLRCGHSGNEPPPSPTPTTEPSTPAASPSPSAGGN